MLARAGTGRRGLNAPEDAASYQPFQSRVLGRSAAAKPLPLPRPPAPFRRSAHADARLTPGADRQITSHTRAQRQRKEAPQGAGTVQYVTALARSLPCIASRNGAQ